MILGHCGDSLGLVEAAALTLVALVGAAGVALFVIWASYKIVDEP